eukprot:TRINITY_DN725_c0_g1_i3.p1 TRINITY_DN725_c0_g1~~TRINITY_DN725_c0_g1_i3.p1  ORF type:complete len:114 (+),score=9.62 TRINITY_DN725_c0_g1_i3:1-342(+)
MIRRPPRSTPIKSSAASDVYKRQAEYGLFFLFRFQGRLAAIIFHESGSIPYYDVGYPEYHFLMGAFRLYSQFTPQIDGVPLLALMATSKLLRDLMKPIAIRHAFQYMIMTERA